MDWGILENETEGVRIAGDKMLTKRQYSILSFYVENRGTYVSSNELAAMFDISVRTVKNELKIDRNAYTGRLDTDVEKTGGAGGYPMLQ